MYYFPYIISIVALNNVAQCCVNVINLLLAII